MTVAKKKNPMPVLLMTIPQACETLSMKRGRVVGLIRSGNLEVVRIGQRNIRIKTDSVKRYVEDMKAVDPKTL